MFEFVEYMALSPPWVFMRLAQRGRPFWDGSRYHFTQTWHALVQSLQLADMHFAPYSFRRGGATAAYRNGQHSTP